MVKISIDLASPVTKRLIQLKSDLVFSAATGNYKGFKNAVKEHAKLAVDNFELSKSIKAPEIKAPLFSKTGIRMAKVWFLNLFRVKTPEEKALKQMAKQEKLKREAQKYMSNV